jgi:antitoxin VapB
MALSIKNDRAEQLARSVAEKTGDTLTGAITRALEERLERIRGPKEGPELAARLRAISERCAALPDVDSRPENEILGYDEHGLFR